MSNVPSLQLWNVCSLQGHSAGRWQVHAPGLWLSCPHIGVNFILLGAPKASKQDFARGFKNEDSHCHSLNAVPPRFLW
jgi:hypothetical protein